MWSRNWSFCIDWTHEMNREPMGVWVNITSFTSVDVIDRCTTCGDTINNIRDWGAQGVPPNPMYVGLIWACHKSTMDINDVLAKCFQVTYRMHTTQHKAQLTCVQGSMWSCSLMSSLSHDPPCKQWIEGEWSKGGFLCPTLNHYTCFRAIYNYFQC